MNNLYEEYAILEAEIKERELKKEQLRPLILKQLVDNGLEKVETSLGKFTVTKSKVWSYPAKVQEFVEETTEKITELSDEIKTVKAKAESTGEATYEEKEGLRFTITKL